MTAVDEELGRLGAAVRDALPELSSEQAAEQRARLLSSGDEQATDSRGALGRWSGIAIAAAVLVGLVVAGVAALSRPRLETLVASTPWSPDASQVVGAIAKLDHEEPAEPEAPRSPSSPRPEAVVLESGRIDVEQGMARKIVAGPYVVTSGPDSGFELTWDAEAETLTLEVDRGEVSVAGASSHHVVVAGNTVRSTAHEFVVVHTSTKKRAVDSAGVKVSAPAWVRAAKRGEYRDALARAKAGRVLESLGTLGREELKLLADATRLGGGAASSESVLLELRRRFPRSKDAKRAAFYLGRFSEGAGRSEDAVRWYREYLKDAAKGSFAAQARGRIVKVLSRNGTAREAELAALEYLKHHPKGAYAPLALRLAKSSTGAP